LRQQKIYWKQRGTLRWVTEGDASTKFFHANATIKHRINFIASLENAARQAHSAHHDKANILWDAYKDRLGQSEYGTMLLNLESLLLLTTDLSSLEEPFTHEEIDQVVSSLRSDKSPGPDDFNTDFIKKCWPIIKQDFYNLIQSFRDGSPCLQSLNTSYITLIPKTVQSCLEIGLSS